jgi:hypothetical protein
MRDGSTLVFSIPPQAGAKQIASILNPLSQVKEDTMKFAREEFARREKIRNSDPEPQVEKPAVPDPIVGSDDPFASLLLPWPVGPDDEHDPFVWDEFFQ